MRGKFFLLTFGCKVNQYESEAIREAWVRQGFEECKDPAAADFILLNTCAVTYNGERDARRALDRLHGCNPSATIFVTGCAARLLTAHVPSPNAPLTASLNTSLNASVHAPLKDPLRDCSNEGANEVSMDSLKELLKNTADGSLRPNILAIPHKAKPLLLHPNDLIPQTFNAKNRPANTSAAETILSPVGGGYADQGEEGEQNEQNEQGGYPPFALERSARSRAILKVQDGCSHRCTYCIVPLIRNKPASRPIQDVISEARRLLGNGYSELVLSGINLRQYGIEQKKEGTFWELVRTLDRELAGDFAGNARIRISSVEPSQLTKEGLDVLATGRMICPHLHISLQHTQPTVLRRMGRGHYRLEDLVRALEGLSSFWPVFALGCDLIAGFPGETEDDHDMLLAACADLPFTYAHVFPYSKRPGTPAADFPDQVDERVRLRRAKALRDCMAEKNRTFREDLLRRGMPLTVIPELTELADGQPHEFHSEPPEDAAADGNGSGDRKMNEGKDGKNGRAKGICEFYVRCLFDRRRHTGQAPFSAVPTALTDKGLLVD